MPTYEYECKSCGHSFEAFQSMSDAPIRDCPQCGKEVRRLINGGTGVIFKGSGFYVTDKKAGASKDKGAKKPDDKKTGDKKPDSACASCPAAASACPAAGNGGSGSSTGNAGAGSSAAKAAG
ncbi:MAG: zinc ribbon domain-containing protein [Treponema sp.]|jgi:putative FmdB family regulatory protein|nr:zinc ribbon domain-containing protein [Treponema sp.]